MIDAEKQEIIRKLEEISTACLACARNDIQVANVKPDGVVAYWEGISTAYEHAIAVISGTDQSGPAWDDTAKLFGP